MQLIEKLSLNHRPIQFIKEGLFFKVYNESLFLVTTHFKVKLKPQVSVLKSTNECVLYGGFPVDSMVKRFPQAKPTAYGYELVQAFDLSGYRQWHNMTINHVKADNNKSKKLPLSFSEPNRETKLELTGQQYCFLQSWQPNKYPTNVDTAFILSLKQHFIRT